MAPLKSPPRRPRARRRAAAKSCSKPSACSRPGPSRFATRSTASRTSHRRNRNAGIVAYSTGNYAQAVAWAARTAGVAAMVVMSSDTDRAKAAATRRLGAEVRSRRLVLTRVERWPRNVVDAATGKGLARWPGMAARPSAAPTPNRLARWQERLAGPWEVFADGCRCDQETLAMIERTLRIERLEREEWRGMPKLLRPLIIGEARVKRPEPRTQRQGDRSHGP